MRNVLLPIACLFLAGCATPAERAAQLEREVEEMIQVYGPACEKLGFKGDTDGWRQCILRLSARDSYRRTPTNTTCFGHRGFYQCTNF